MPDEKIKQLIQIFWDQNLKLIKDQETAFLLTRCDLRNRFNVDELIFAEDYLKQIKSEYKGS